MSSIHQDANIEFLNLKNCVIRYVSPIAAMLYPLTLMGFHACIEAVNTADEHSVLMIWLSWIAAGMFLLIAFAIPLLALFMTMRLSSIETPTLAETRARLAALLAVATPPIFTLIGVIFYMLGIADYDKWLVTIFWAVLVINIAYGEDRHPVNRLNLPDKTKLGTAHGVTALGILLIFLIGHLANQFTGLFGEGTHTIVMKTLRHIYRSPLVEPILLLGFLFQIVTGFYLVRQFTNTVTDQFRTFQIASGVYLIFFLVSHINAVLILARTYLNIDPGWGFATGMPAGLIQDAWNIRLLPLYGYALFFVLSHLASGARVVMLAHGKRQVLADRVMIWGAVFAALFSTAVLSGMCGLRLH